MSFHSALLFLLHVSSLLSPLTLAAPQYCKPTSDGPHWPSPQEWKALNKTIEGHLIAPVPPGSVCQPDSPNYNNASCSLVVEDWAKSDWHARNPFTSDYNDDTCLPNALAPCSKTGYPAYVVNATTRAHVQAGINFAHRTGVRLVIKGTGHDVPARSSGPNSISIYTHNIRGIHINKRSARAEVHGAVAEVKIAAGMRMFEIYEATKDANLTIVGGGDMNVGIGGWITGGAHSPLSSYFGMGADQVLEMEVVTADGQYHVINATSSPELFWAMRGGGGSTYAVMLSVTVKAYSQTPTVTYAFAFNTSANSDTYWNTVGYFHSQLPYISEKGGMGYYYLFPNDATSPNTAYAGKILGAFFFPFKTRSQATSIMAPLINHVNTSSTSSSPISVETLTTPPIDFTTFWLTNTPEGVGMNSRLGSYLLTNDTLLSNNTALTSILRSVTPPDFVTLGHLIAGPGVRNARIPGGTNAVLPAWRRAYVHLVLPRSWPYLNATAKKMVTTELREVEVPKLKALEPRSGAYVNEGDPTNPDWKEDYWGGGEHYARLLRVKKRWDPDGVFWCKPCVGHDEWEIKGNDGSDGIGQEGLQLCRK